MKENIFSSFFTNKFCDQKVEDAYKNKTKISLLKFTKWFSIILFIFSLIASILEFTGNNLNGYKLTLPNTQAVFPSWVIYLVTGIFFLNTLITIIFRKKYLLIKISSLYNLYAVVYIFMYISFYVTLISTTIPWTIIYLLFFTEFLFRIGMIIYSAIEFPESLFINFLVIFTLWIVNYAFGMIDVKYSFIIFHNIQTILSSIYTYFYTKETRKSFYYYEKEKEKKLWYQNLMEKMNSGFMLIKNGKIEFMNKAIIENFYLKSNFVSKIIYKENEINIINNKFNEENLKINRVEKQLIQNDCLLINNKNENFTINKKINIENYFIHNELSEVNYNLKFNNNLKIKEKLNDKNLDKFIMEENFILENSDLILYELLSETDFVLSNELNSTQQKNLNLNRGKEEFPKKILNLIREEFEEHNKFIFMGTKGFKNHNFQKDFKKLKFSGVMNNEKEFIIPNSDNLSCKNQDFENIIYYDISIRFYKTAADEYFEIILNDISNTKIREKENAEFKLKTVFLSKVAHEFKNPVICIIELIDQINDFKNKLNSRKNNKNNLNYENIDKILSQINGISNYLLILVKDLDFFSSTQNKINFQIENKKCDIKEIINFVEEMANILLKRADKSDKIKFIIEKDLDLENFIYTDEIKLKQILINLLSNSVKFTHFGQIILRIQNNLENERNLDFILKDTGIGFNIENVPFSLFKKKVNKDNYLGSGLGLSIITELTSKLGSEVKICSEVGKGSEFFFSVKNNGKNITNKLPKFDKIEKSQKALNINKKFKSQSFKTKSISTVKISFEHENLLKNSFNLKSKNSFSKTFVKKDLKKNNSDNDINESISISIQTELLTNQNFILENKKNIKTLSNYYKNEENSEYSTYEKKKDNLELINNSLQNLEKEKFINLEKEELVLIKNSDFFDNINSKDCGNKFTNTINYCNNHRDDINDIGGFINEGNINPKNSNEINIIIADDEELTRQSTIRMIKKNFEVNNLNEKNELKIYEAKDGLDCLSKFYQLTISGKKIYCIISDEFMYLMNGSECSIIIKNVSEKNQLRRIPFFIITAYPKDNFTYNIKNSVDQMYNKPIKFEEVNDLFSELICK